MLVLILGCKNITVTTSSGFLEDIWEMMAKVDV